MRFSSCSFYSACALLLLTQYAKAFQTSSLKSHRSESSIVRFGYVPDGFTAESYKKFKEDEKKKKQNLGRVGPRGFKSRSMQSFQEALEKGEAKHLMPVFNAKQKIASGKLVSRLDLFLICKFSLFSSDFFILTYAMKESRRYSGKYNIDSRNDEEKLKEIKLMH